MCPQTIHIPEELKKFAERVGRIFLRLKYINDEFGHKAGDEIIIAASDVILESFPEYDVFARVGGDEFYFLSTSNTLDVEEGKRKLGDLTSKWKGELAPCLSISCGHAYDKNVTEDMYLSLLHKADQEMYKDKTRYYQENSIDRRRG